MSSNTTEVNPIRTDTEMALHRFAFGFDNDVLAIQEKCPLVAIGAEWRARNIWRRTEREEEAAADRLLSGGRWPDQGRPINLA